MGNTSYIFNDKSTNDYKYKSDIAPIQLSDTYRTISQTGNKTQFNDKYYSDETIDTIIHDISTNNDENYLKKLKQTNQYIDCSNNCSTKIDNYNSLINKDNLKKDPNLHLDEYSRLKYLDEEINKTGMLATKYYILLYIWFIIMIILLFVFVITIFSNNNEINPIVHYIITLFFIYCIYEIYKNIYN